MTSPHAKRDQAPAPLQREFAHHWNGYDRNEVRQHLDLLDEDRRRLIAERDAAVAKASGLAKQLDAARTDNGKLQARVDELLEPPKNLDDLDQRMQRVGRLSYLKAEEVTARAQTATEENWKATAKASISLRERYRTLLKELDSHAEALHAEHRAALEETRAEVKELMVDAVRRRDALDAEAERKRRKIEQEFDATMAAQRRDLEKYLSDQRTAAKQQAERRMAEAQAEAKRTVSEATAMAKRRTNEANAVIDRLLAISQDAHSRLDSADKLLARTEEMLKPTEEEQQPVLRAEDAVPAPKPKSSPAEGNGEKTKPATEPVAAKQNQAGSNNRASDEQASPAGGTPSPRPHAEAARANSAG